MAYCIDKDGKLVSGEEEIKLAWIEVPEIKAEEIKLEIPEKVKVSREQKQAAMNSLYDTLVRLMHGL